MTKNIVSTKTEKVKKPAKVLSVLEPTKYHLGYIPGAKEGEFGSKTHINWYDDK